MIAGSGAGRVGDRLHCLAVSWESAKTPRLWGRSREKCVSETGEDYPLIAGDYGKRAIAQRRDAFGRVAESTEKPAQP